MKKLLCTLLLFTLTLQLFACGAKQGDASAPASSPAAQESQAELAESSAPAESKPDAVASSTPGSDSSEAKPAADAGETRVVIDHGGREVRIPKKVTRIVIDQVPILSTYMAYFGGKAPYLVGISEADKSVIQDTVLGKITPSLVDGKSATYIPDELNIEEVIKLKPDVVFFNINNKNNQAILEKSGIPCIGFATVGKEMPADPTKLYVEWLRLLEQVFDEPGKMDDFVNYGKTMMEDIEGQIAKVPEADRPTAMILFKYAKGKIKVAGKGVFGDFWLKHLGTKNVAGDLKGFADANIEQIYQWDPDIMFLNGPGLLSLTPSDIIDGKTEGTDFSPIKAVQNKRVYKTDLGMWNWFTPNPDAPLVLGWLAKCAYPDQFKDYDLEGKIREYYKTFYHYELSDEEVAHMFIK